MKLSIIALHLMDFKGVRDETYNFGDIVKIMAANGIGKTTIATAWFWLLTDKDYALRSNPNVIPIGVEECLPRVEAMLDIDGIKITIAKQQKITNGKPDTRGISKRTLSNTYEINSVPKTERDFKADLEDKGINFELLLAVSHPNVFTSQKASEMRKVLFKMCTDKTDLDIALLDPETKDVADLLVSYKYDEIEKMNKASKKKAEEQVKAIPNQIIGLEKAKIDNDTAELELAANGLKEQITGKEKQLDDNKSALEEYQKATDGIMDLRFKMSDIERQATDKLNAQKKDIRIHIDATNQAFNDAMRSHSRIEMDINRLQDNINRDDAERKGLGAEYKAASENAFDDAKWAFDEKSTICPMCAREYETDKVESIKSEFEANREKARQEFEADKKSEMQRLISKGNNLKEKVSKANAEIINLNAELEKVKEQKLKANKDNTKAMEELSKLPERIDLSENQEYEALQQQVIHMEKSLEAMNSGSSYRSALKGEITNLRNELSDVEAQIAKASNNVYIDEQIGDLQGKQRDYEQTKADAEKIIYQLSLVSKKKNEMLVEEINSNFSVVKWKLFDYMKNGNYTEVCVPQIKGKSLGSDVNTGDEVLAKIDICSSLQKFFGVNLPIFVDNSECLSSNSLEKVKVMTQMIYLRVTEDEELKFLYAD